MKLNYILKDSHFSLFSKLMNSSGIGLLIVDLDSGQINWGNENYYRITGSSEEEKKNNTFTKKLLEQLQIKSTVDIKYITDLSSFESGAYSISKLCIQNNKGSWIWIHIEVAVYHPNVAHPGQLLIMISDIKENSLINISDGESDSDTNEKSHEHPLLQSLSKREIEILKLIVIGHTNKKIADVLCISSNTVDTHRKNIIRKLKVNNTTRLAYIVGKNDLI